MSDSVTPPALAAVEFDEDSHTYRVGGREVPSVTRILDWAGLMDNAWSDEEALKRGSYVHAALEFDDQGDLDEPNLDPNLAGYVAAWRRAKAEVGFLILPDWIERKVFHPIYQYAGMIDRLVAWKDTKAVVDIKSGSPSPWHAIQLALYALTFTTERVVRLNVYVDRSGGYRLVEHKDRTDFEIAKAALTVGLWRKEKGLIK